MNNLLRWIPAVFWMGVIFYLSDQTGSELGSLFPFLDNFNWGHYVAYFILALAVYWAIHHRNWKYAKWYVVIFCVIYGITDEWHQSFVPNRTPDLRDLVNNTIGASLAMIATHLWERRKRLS